ncbi:hypothetical protein TYRP_014479 [Tyrophagus putrescentiae]|nr:hypothetical protein TYRP_014479 [Tyrophagus putrescentiae]
MEPFVVNILRKIINDDQGVKAALVSSPFGVQEVHVEQFQWTIVLVLTQRIGLLALLCQHT